MTRFQTLARSALMKFIGDDLASLQQLTVLLAPSGFGKSVARRHLEQVVTGADARLKGGSLPSRVHWVPLAAPASDSGFWRELALALDLPESASPRERVEAWAQQLESPHVLLVDSYESVTSPVVDKELVALLQTAPKLKVVLAATEVAFLLHPLLTSRLAPKVVGEENLRFTAKETVELAELLGVGKGMALAEQDAMGGWPLGVRVALMGCALGDRLGTLQQFAEDLCNSLPSVEARLMATAIATCPGLDYRIIWAELGLDASESRELAEQLRRAGIVCLSDDGNKLHYRCQPVLKPFLFNHAPQIWDPEKLDALVRAQALEIADKKPIQAVGTLVSIEKYQDACDVVARHQVTAVRGGWATLEALRKIPLQTVKNYPQLMLTRLTLERPNPSVPIEIVEEFTRHAADASMKALETANAETMLPSLVAAIATQRMTGGWDAAVALGRDTLTRLTGPPGESGWTRRGLDPLPFASIASSALLAGKLDLAVESAKAGLPIAVELGQLREERYLSSILALTALWQGDATEARALLERVEEIEPEEPDSSDLESDTVLSGKPLGLMWVEAELARTFLATQEGDLDAARANLDRLLPLVDRIEHWPLAVLAESEFLIRVAGFQHAYTALEERLLSKPEHRAVSPYFMSSINSRRATLAMGRGRFGEARERLTEVDPTYEHTEVNPVNGQVMISEVHVAEPGTPPFGSSLTPGAAGSPSSPSSSSPETDQSWMPTEKYSWLGAIGYTDRSLHETFGIPPEVGAVALDAQTQDQLLDVAGAYPGWVSDVLLGLAAGDSPTIIKETLELMRKVPEDTAADAAILEALETNIGKAQYTVVEGEEELRQVLEGGSLAAWRNFLHPEQRKYASMRYRGPFRLSGAAGTGKTVVLLHRTKTLAKRYPGSRILLTTFTKTLAEGLEDQLELLDPSIKTVSLGNGGVCVSGVDAAVAQVLRSNTKVAQEAAALVLGQARPEMYGRLADSIWDNVLDTADLSGLPERAANAKYLRAEYETVILPARVTTLEQYLRVRRPGRGLALNRARRKALWAVIEAYRAEARIQGGLSFAEAAAVATACLDVSGQTWVDHALIDEGQDLSAVQWQFLRALVAPGEDDMFIAEDSQQRIYAPQVVLSHCGISIVGRSRRLLLSYRTTAQNLKRAVSALEGAQFAGLDGKSVEEEMVEDAGSGLSATVRPAGLGSAIGADGSGQTSPVGESPSQSPLPSRSSRMPQYRALRNGPDPRDYVADGAEYLEVITGAVTKWLESGAREKEIGVLVPDGFTARMVTGHLSANSIKTRQVHRSRGAGDQVTVITMHRAKGLEFVNVVVLLPRPRPYETDEDALLQQRCLQYVAMSRARDGLAVVSQT